MTILQTASSGEYRAGSYASNAGTYMVNMVKIKGTSWVIVVRALETEIYWDIRELGVVLATAGIIVIAAITIALIIIVRKIVIPIQDLTNTIVAVTDGDFTKEVHVKGHDEVSVMAGSMKHFMETMRHTLGSIMHISSRIDVQAKGSNSISGELLDSASGQAEETNLLALNASIEAARAGEAGRGFAAADQFNSIYESIEGTSRIVNDMIAKVRQANDVASNMAAITQEQSASAEEIEATAVNIQELADNVTKHSSNVKTGSTELADTASTLKEKISGFTIE